jgi:hypothetical protein
MNEINSFFKKIFSVENEYILGRKIKIFRLFGVKIEVRIKPKFTDKEIMMLKDYCRVKKFRTINKESIISKIENMKESGIMPDTRQRTPKLIVSLTSYPARMYDIHYCLYSLLSQTVKPDKVILWLAHEQFPGKEEDVPKKVKALKEFGLTIAWTKDLKSYKKLIPALKEYPEDIIVTADDDIYYETDWLEKLYKNYDGESILSHRSHRIILKGGKITSYGRWKQEIDGNGKKSFLNLFTGAGGVLYPPRVLYGDILKDELFMELSPTNDDLWFWSMTVLNNVKIKVIENNNAVLTYINPEREMNINGDETLCQINYPEGNDRQLAALFKYYPLILEKLRDEKS